ncbi:HK97 gp10 family phage protein [Rhizobium sp. 16-449-1b]|uniref:HK97-gp10 family putative phage morphogenesis protein n=1 Tax=Rhizobium sp. 16-449-1b TaxID=2819989 RepID=UPI001ADBC0C9|nr:HK97-gp10 family putative phage morphogenesis protein [Rhizobium sp. 16-449-1b]MBO9194330.1 HK97 gp10 family phage protein [Rhizobium sp. 16-449-1b]
MVMVAEIKGREALMRRLNALAPNVEKYAAEAKMAAGKELADEIRVRAPRVSGFYADSIEAAPLNSAPKQVQVGIKVSKDPSAVGIFAEYIWRFLEFGTAPHNTAKGGGTVAGKKQARAGNGNIHPGMPAQPHVFPTYRAMKKKIRRRILAAVNKAVREAMGK